MLTTPNVEASVVIPSTRPWSWTGSDEECRRWRKRCAERYNESIHNILSKHKQIAMHMVKKTVSLKRSKFQKSMELAQRKLKRRNVASEKLSERSLHNQSWRRNLRRGKIGSTLHYITVLPTWLNFNRSITIKFWSTSPSRCESLQVQKEMQVFDTVDPVSITEFFQTFIMAWDNNGIHERLPCGGSHILWRY